jgi:hypothetical protein
MMEYFWMLGVVIVVLPLIVLLASRRGSNAGEKRPQRDHGVTVAEPSSDQPTPGAPNSINQPGPGAERQLPPG